MNELPTKLLITAAAIVIRWCVSLNSYSGEGKSPMFGDYEAQRHWMELTYHLPIKQWYVNGSSNDLQYWGLDYPPLTAYHSYMCGFVAHRINSSWVALDESRGHESQSHKLFMRYTVLMADLLFFFPAVFSYFYQSSGDADHTKSVACLATLLYPGLILVDHGHFQYNTVSLALWLWAVIALCQGYHLLGSVAFVLALNYKQMELYHALPFFAYLLGNCFKSKGNGLWKFVKLGTVVVVTFACCWLPFLQDLQMTLQVVSRLFPLGRGIFEDKVANIWCSLSVLIKFKQLLSVSTLFRMCLVTTILGSLPHTIDLLRRPSLHRFKLALINSSLVFFLFSFQVHEKSILLVALPVCLVLPQYKFQCVWFLLITSFSMLPLFIKDGLMLPFCATLGLFCLVTMTTTEGYPVDVKSISNRRVETVSTPQQDFVHPLLLNIRNLSLVGAAVLSLASVSLAPPAHLPDIFTVLIATYACVHFVFFLFYFYWVQLTYCNEKDDQFGYSTSAHMTDLNIGTEKYPQKRNVKGKML